MALNARTKKDASGGGNRPKQPNLEPGGYPSRVVQVIDLGLQAQKPYQGQEKPPVQMINLTYELSDEFMLDEDGQPMEDKPRWISETLPFYSLEKDKAKSTQRYKAIDPNEEAEGDWTELVGWPVTVNIVNNPSRQDPSIIYDNVRDLSTMRQKEAKSLPNLVNEPRVFVLDEPDLDVFRELPEFLQNRIKENLEYSGSKLEALLSGGSSEPQEDNSGSDNEPEENEQQQDDQQKDW